VRLALHIVLWPGCVMLCCGCAAMPCHAPTVQRGLEGSRQSYCCCIWTAAVYHSVRCRLEVVTAGGALRASLLLQDGKKQAGD
jgi:hypothetical protein